jgi:hypothetical protein
MIRGRGGRDDLLGDRPFINIYQVFVRAGPTGHRYERGVGIRGKGGEEEGVVLAMQEQSCQVSQPEAVVESAQGVGVK